MKKTLSTYTETPRGIFTAAGLWFNTTSDILKGYAPGLFKKHNLGEIIADAEVWIRSADSLSIMIFMLLLAADNLYLAVFGVLVFLPVWHLNKSAFITYGSTGLLRLIDNEFFLVLLSIIVLSWMGMTEQYVSLAVGFLFFIFLKFGLYRKLIEYAFNNPNKLPLNDRALKMVVVKYAMYEGESTNDVQAMESQIHRLISDNKKK
ncbi:MAG: hypothetical protein WD267_01480 [Balneolales bacterium]